MTNSPCLNCSDRHINCHNTCKDYLKFKSIKHIENKIINNDRMVNSMLTEIYIKKYKRRK